MTMKVGRENIVIIECPTNLGLAKPFHASEPGVKKLPAWLMQWGLHAMLQPVELVHVPASPYTSNIDATTGVLNADAIVADAILQSEHIAEQIQKGRFLMILGGDCSLLLGTAIGLKKTGVFGLFYLDGHTDFILPEQSHTHGAAGMDLALACGYGPQKLANIHQFGPYFNDSNVFCVGNREYDEAYERPIKESGVRYVPLNELRRQGIPAIAQQFLEMMAKHQLDGFVLHFDVDVLADEIMPAVDSRQSSGLTYAEMEELLAILFQSKKCCGMEITILDPDLDPDGKYTSAFVAKIAPIINSLK